MNRPVDCDAKGFILNGRRVFINSGELQYFRIPPSQWRDRLLKAKRAFVNTLGSYVAWNWHERTENQFVFDGDRDLDRWLALAEELDLLVFIRPTPYLCGEWDFGGFPNWLIPKDCELRSLETDYLEYCTRFIKRSNEIIKPHLLANGGNVCLYQIENEFMAGDIEYHLKLKEIVEHDGIDVPICTNENDWAWGSSLMAGEDPYLRTWNVNEVVPRIKDMLKYQADKPALGLEVGVHYFVLLYGRLPFGEGYNPPELDEFYLKLLIGLGLSGYNYYMYHGGTNPGYWTGGWPGNGIATSYDFEAPIREWGELGPCYWGGRRIGGFLECFGDQLCEARPVEDGCSVDNPAVRTFIRRDGDESFIFLSNPYAMPRSLKITVGDLVIPANGDYRIPGYTMAMLAVNLKLWDGGILRYSTSEIFYFIDNEREKFLIVYGEPGLSGETAIEVDGKTSVINYEYSTNPQVFAVDGSVSFKLIVLDKTTASRTWFADYKGGKYPIISNIYFMEDEHENRDGVSLSFQMKEGPNWLETPLKPGEVTTKGLAAVSAFDETTGMTRIDFADTKMPQIEYDLNGIWKVDRLGQSLEGEWLDWKPWEGLEYYGFLKNGYAWYQTRFDVDDASDPLTLSLTGFQDEASVYINGEYVASGRQTLTADISEFVRERDNLLVVLVESLGHCHLGERTFNGINCPAYVFSKEQNLPLRTWKRHLVPETFPEKSLLMAERPEIAPTFDDSAWESVKVDSRWDTRLLKNSSEECFVWYRTTVDIPADFSDSLSLDMGSGQAGEIYLFVNGEYCGLRKNNNMVVPAAAFSFDLDGKLRVGENHLAIGIKVSRWFLRYGLLGPVSISSRNQMLTGDWKISEGIAGQSIYPARDYDDSDWAEIDNRCEPESKPGSLVWYRKSVKIHTDPSLVAPLRITLKDTPGKALIYFNGVLIGRYASNGSQEDFYIFEDLIDEDNVVAILLDGRDEGAALGSVNISPYYIARKVGLHLQCETHAARKEDACNRADRAAVPSAVC